MVDVKSYGVCVVASRFQKRFLVYKNLSSIRSRLIEESRDFLAVILSGDQPRVLDEWTGQLLSLIRMLLSSA
jgi:hypothetical protein